MAPIPEDSAYSVGCHVPTTYSDVAYSYFWVASNILLEPSYCQQRVP